MPDWTSFKGAWGYNGAASASVVSAAAANAAEDPPPPAAALRWIVGELIGRITGAAGGNKETRRQLLALANEAGRLISANDLDGADASIAKLERMLVAAERPPPPPTVSAAATSNPVGPQAQQQPAAAANASNMVSFPAAGGNRDAAGADQPVRVVQVVAQPNDERHQIQFDLNLAGQPNANANPPAPPLVRRPAPLDKAVREQLITYEELTAKIGQPKADRLGGLWKMSERSKAIGQDANRLIPAAQRAGELPLKTMRASGASQQALLQGVDKLVASCTAYQAKHPDKRADLQPMIDKAATYKRALQQALADPQAAALGDTVTVDQAIFIKECGIRFADCKFDAFNDNRLAPGGAQNGAGAGACNIVDRLVHLDANGNVPQARYFKPLQREDRSDKGPRKAIGLDENAPNYGPRNLASRAVAEVLGLDVIPETEIASHDGRVGLLMAEAPGKAIKQKVWSNADGWAKDAEDCVAKGLHDLLNGWRLAKRDGRWMRWSEENVWPSAERPSAKAVASVQEGLNGLEWCDLITGQADRHSGNYFIDIRGDKAKVTGIDNDFCFGENQTGLFKTDISKGITSVGTPLLIDQKIYNRLQQVNFDLDLLPRLKDLLSAKEVAASRQRFDAAKQEAQHLFDTGKLVKDWQAEQSPEGRERTFAEDIWSLFGRDLRKSLDQLNGAH
jgi:hypothetical protein